MLLCFPLRLPIGPPSHWSETRHYLPVALPLTDRHARLWSPSNRYVYPRVIWFIKGTPSYSRVSSPRCGINSIIVHIHTPRRKCRHAGLTPSPAAFTVVIWTTPAVQPAQGLNCRPGPCEGVAGAMSASRVVCKVVQFTVKQRQLHANICNGDAS